MCRQHRLAACAWLFSRVTYVAASCDNLMCLFCLSLQGGGAQPGRRFPAHLCRVLRPGGAPAPPAAHGAAHSCRLPRKLPFGGWQRSCFADLLMGIQAACSARACLTVALSPQAAFPFVYLVPLLMAGLSWVLPGVGAPVYIPSSLLRYIAFKFSHDLQQIPGLNELIRAALRLMLNGDKSEWDRALQVGAAWFGVCHMPTHHTSLLSVSPAPTLPPIPDAPLQHLRHARHQPAHGGAPHPGGEDPAVPVLNGAPLRAVPAPAALFLCCMHCPQSRLPRCPPHMHAVRAAHPDPPLPDVQLRLRCRQQGGLRAGHAAGRGRQLWPAAGGCCCLRVAAGWLRPASALACLQRDLPVGLVCAPQGLPVDLVAGGSDGIIAEVDVHSHYEAMRAAGVQVESRPRALPGVPACSRCSTWALNQADQPRHAGAGHVQTVSECGAPGRDVWHEGRDPEIRHLPPAAPLKAGLPPSCTLEICACSVLISFDLLPRCLMLLPRSFSDHINAWKCPRRRLKPRQTGCQPERCHDWEVSCPTNTAAWLARGTHPGSRKPPSRPAPSFP